MRRDGPLFLLQIQTDLWCIEEDINSVERHRTELYRGREKSSLKPPRMLANDPNSQFYTQSGPIIARKKWVHAEVSNLGKYHISHPR